MKHDNVALFLQGVLELSINDDALFTRNFQKYLSQQVESCFEDKRAVGTSVGTYSMEFSYF